MTQTFEQSEDSNAFFLSDEAQAQIADTGGLGTIQIHRDSGEILTNRASFRLFGLEPVRALTFDRVIQEAVHVDDRQGLLAAYDAACDPASAGTLEAEFRVIHPEGDIHLLCLNARCRGDDETGMRVEGVLQDITQNSEALRKLNKLNAALQHRIRTILSTVQSLAFQSFRVDPNSNELYQAFRDRLTALSRIHDLLADRGFEGSFIEPLINQVFEAGNADLRRVEMSGFPARFGRTQTVAFGLILNELMLNAMRYGALSVPEGKIRISWKMRPASELIDITWSEQDGPAVMIQRKGQGMRLIERICAVEFGGIVKFGFDVNGMSCKITIANSKLRSEA